MFTFLNTFQIHSNAPHTYVRKGGKCRKEKWWCENIEKHNAVYFAANFIISMLLYVYNINIHIIILWSKYIKCKCVQCGWMVVYGRMRMLDVDGLDMKIYGSILIFVSALTCCPTSNIFFPFPTLPLISFSFFLFLSSKSLISLFDLHLHLYLMR